MRVYDGQALVKEADGQVKVKGGRELDFAPNGPLKAQKSIKRWMRTAICIAGAVCDLVMWQKPTWMRLGSMRRADGVRGGRAGGVRVGIGTRGSADSLLFRETEFSISPFGWGFYSPRYVYGAPFYGYGFGPLTVTAGTTTITSARTCTTGGPVVHYVAGQNYSGGIYRGPGAVGTRLSVRPGVTGGSRGGGFRRGVPGPPLRSRPLACCNWVRCLNNRMLARRVTGTRKCRVSS